MKSKITAVVDRYLDAPGCLGRLDHETNKEMDRIFRQLSANIGGYPEASEFAERVLNHPDLTLRLYRQETKRNQALHLRETGGNWVGVYVQGDVHESFLTGLTNLSEDTAIEWLEIAESLQQKRRLKAGKALLMAFEEQRQRDHDRAMWRQRVLPIMEENPRMTANDAIELLQKKTGS